MNLRELFQCASDDVNRKTLLSKNRPGVYLQGKPFPDLIHKVVPEIISPPRGPPKAAL